MPEKTLTQTRPLASRLRDDILQPVFQKYVVVSVLPAPLPDLLLSHHSDPLIPHGRRDGTSGDVFHPLPALTLIHDIIIYNGEYVTF